MPKRSDSSWASNDWIISIFRQRRISLWLKSLEHMVRVKGGVQTRKNHKKVLQLAKGYRMTRHKQIKKATEAVLHAGQYAFHGRKLRKRDFRSLWITRLNAAVREQGMSYSLFIKALKEKRVELDRKVLAQMVVEHPQAFTDIVKQVKG